MNGYARITKNSSTRSKSMDFADLSRSTENYCKNKSRETKPNHNSLEKHESILENESESGDGIGENFGIILGRKCLVTSSASFQNVMVEPQNASFQTLIKKSLSIKRSALMSEGYCRIHHQCDSTAADDDQFTAESTSQKMYKEKKGKFLKACQRLFGL